MSAGRETFNLLICHETASFRNSIAYMAAALPFRCCVRPVADVEGALEALRLETFDGIVLSWRRPGDLDAVRAVRAGDTRCETDALVVALTSGPTPELVSSAMRQGVDALLVPPLSPKTFAARVVAALDRKAAARHAARSG